MEKLKEELQILLGEIILQEIEIEQKKARIIEIELKIKTLQEKPIVNMKDRLL